MKGCARSRWAWCSECRRVVRCRTSLLAWGELRVKDAGSTARVFYITKVAELIIVFHGFEKNTPKTPRREIELGKKRLKEILDETV